MRLGESHYSITQSFQGSSFGGLGGGRSSLDFIRPTGGFRSDDSAGRFNSIFSVKTSSAFIPADISSLLPASIKIPNQNFKGIGDAFTPIKSNPLAIRPELNSTYLSPSQFPRKLEMNLTGSTAISNTALFPQRATIGAANFDILAPSSDYKHSRYIAGTSSPFPEEMSGAYNSRSSLIGVGRSNRVSTYMDDPFGSHSRRSSSLGQYRNMLEEMKHKEEKDSRQLKERLEKEYADKREKQKIYHPEAKVDYYSLLKQKIGDRRSRSSSHSIKLPVSSSVIPPSSNFNQRIVLGSTAKRLF